MSDTILYESDESYEASAALQRAREMQAEDARAQVLVAWVAICVLIAAICAATWMMAQHDAAAWVTPTAQELSR